MSRFLEGEELERFLKNCPPHVVDDVRRNGVAVIGEDDFMVHLHEHLDRRASVAKSRAKR